MWQVELETKEAEQRWRLCALDLTMERISIYIQYDIEQASLPPPLSLTLIAQREPSRLTPPQRRGQAGVVDEGMSP